MDAKDLRTEPALSDRDNEGSKYAQSGVVALQCDRNRTYQDIGSNSLGKVEVQSARPCAVIGPDRIIPQSVANESYLKKGPTESWPCRDIYRCSPEYPRKLSDYQSPTRNISPRQTFQENMQRIMVAPTYNTLKINDDNNYAQMPDRNIALSKNIKLNMPPEVKYCDVPYTINPNNNEQKNVRVSDMCVSSVNPSLTRTAPHCWSSASVNSRPPRPFGAPELYQYHDYPSCAGPRPLVHRPHRIYPEEPGYMFTDPHYTDGNIRFKPYPSTKDRYQPARYDYIGNYANPFHPPPSFPSHKYDFQKSMAHPFPHYTPVKYLDNRAIDPILDQRSQQGNYNMQYHNQVIHSNYGAVIGNCSQNKMQPYPTDSSLKVIPPNKLSHDNNNKVYVEYDNSRPKMYPPSDSYFVNEMTGMPPFKSQVLMHTYPNINMPPGNSYYKKDNAQIKNYEYMTHFRSMDPTINTHNPLIRHPPLFSPNTLALSPSDSCTSNDISQTLGTLQEDCGYVSQSSSISSRSMDSSINRLPNDYYKRYYDSKYGHLIRTSSMTTKNEMRLNSCKEKKNINVRQFLQMWNEGDDEAEENNLKDNINNIGSTNTNILAKTHVANNEQLYVLGLVNVPSEELDKYEHIQKITKLPENIKGYTNIELLNQFEEVIESSNINNFKSHTPKDNLPSSLKETLPKQGLSMLPRPVSPLDVEAKISQSVIHKDVGCNFEIKPCSPKMLNVEIAAPVQNILAERVIEKVTNPVSIKSSLLNNIQDEIDYNLMKRQDHRLHMNEGRIASCKMFNTQFSDINPLDPIKSTYSFQELESNSGLCLASLPRLDNDIELNFPEVNQQFINANKGEPIDAIPSLKDLPTLDVLDHSDNVNNNNEVTVLNQKTKITSISESDKEFSKLSKYRKNKITEDYKLKSQNNEEDNFEKNKNAIRTDSVIIKNPENVKKYDDDLDFSTHCLNKSEHPAINLPSHLNLENNDKKEAVNNCIATNQENQPLALDFSVNRNHETNFKSMLIEMSKEKDNSVFQIIDKHFNENSENCLYNVPVLTPKSSPNNIDNIIDDCNSIDKQSDNLEKPAQYSDQTIELNQHNNLQNKELHIKSEVMKHENEVPTECYINSDCALKSKCQHIENIVNASNNFNSTEKCSDDFNSTEKCSDNLETLPHNNDYKIYLNPQNSSQNKSNMCENQELDIKSEVMKHVNEKSPEHYLDSDCSLNFNSQYNTKNFIQVSDNFNSIEKCTGNLEILPQNSDYKIDLNSNNNLQNNSNVCKNQELDIKSEVTDHANEVPRECYLNSECSLKFNNQCNTENIDVSNNFNLVEKGADDLETPAKNSHDETDLNYNSDQEIKSNIYINSELDLKSGAVKILSMINDTNNKNAIKDECNEGSLNSLTHETKNNHTIEENAIEFQKEDITETDEEVQIICNYESPQNKFNEPITKEEAINISTLNKGNISNSVLHHSSENVYQTVIPDEACDHNLKKTGSLELTNLDILISHVALEDVVTSHNPSNEHDVLLLESKEEKNKCNDSNSADCMGNELSRTLDEQQNSNKLKHYLHLWSKEMFSPWMQKLITFNEGYVVMQTNETLNKGLEKTSTEHLSSMCDSKNIDNTLLIKTQVPINETSGTNVTNLCDYQDEINPEPHQVQPDKIFVDTQNVLNDKVESKNEMALKMPITNLKLTLIDETISTETTETCHKTFSKQNHIVTNIMNPKQFLFEDNKAIIFENSLLSRKDDGNNNLSQSEELDLLNPTDTEQTTNSFQEVPVDTGVLEENQKIEEGIISNAQTNSCSIIQSIHNSNLCKGRQLIKRSLSDSALNVYDIDNNICRENDEDIRLIWPLKRRKINRIESVNSDLLSENLCNIFQNHRRYSISTTYNEDDVSLCILIDNNCIIDQENEEQKICFTELSEECMEIEHSGNDEARGNIEILAPASAETNDTCEYSDSFVIECEESNILGNPWVEDIACVETVISDDVAEDIIISELSSPKDTDVSDNNESDIFSSNEHTDKVKYIYGNKMCQDDARYLETLYKTPQMDVNKTLNIRENRVIEKCDKYYDNDSLEKVLSESNCNTSDLMNSIMTIGVSNASNTPDDKENMNMEIFSPPQSDLNSINVEENIELSYVEQENCQPISQIMKTQDDTVDSCESSIDNVFSYKHEPKEENMNFITSCSPEVSSTTSEEQNSSILLKITNFKGSRVSQINNFVNNRPRCKFTEKNDYLHPHLSYSKNRPLLTKAAQKYIPPLKESIQDLKVKLHLPHHSLMKLKQLKISKDEPKPRIQNNMPRIQKKPKPKFEDVLMSIDEIQFQKHKEKSKKIKKSIPKVVIKKSENGSHYASTSSNNEFNPDLTGRKWQPWVFLEKNPFIDKMVIRKKNKAIYSHRKKTFVLEEKFKKYKCVNTAKFVISQPKTDNQSTGLKYTIRLKHGC